MTRATKRHAVTVDKLLDDMQTVVADAEALLKATAHQAGEKIQEARERASESLAAARERINDLKANAIQRGREAVESGDEYVRANPWRAIGIAGAVGVLLGLLLHRD